jgi:hypothetical protein
MSAAVVALAMGATGVRAADEPSYSELVQQIRSLQAKVEQLEAKQANAITRQDVQTTIRQVMEDAERRSRLLDVQGISAGWNGERFYLKSDDDNFSIMPNALWQFRYVGNFRESVPGSAKTDSYEDGFENRRFRVGIDGNFFTEEFTYKLVISADRGNNASLLDAYGQYRFNKLFAIKAGQFKDVWNQEESVTDDRGLTVERSMLKALLGGSQTERIQGVNFIFFDAQPWRAQAVLHDGATSRNTSWQDAPISGAGGVEPVLGSGDEDFGTTGRLEYFAAGTPKQYSDFTAMGNKQDLLVFGTGADYTQAGDNYGLFHTADAQWENTRGVGLYAAYVALLRQVGSPSTGASGVNAGDFYDYGFVLQASYLVTKKFELFARYDWIRLDAAAFTAQRTVHQSQLQEVTTGFNYYLHGQNLKITVDASYLPNGSPDLPALGFLATEDNSLVIRGQLTFSL